ncbi:unnamed protein product [Coccothraustes coccothraustes]
MSAERGWRDLGEPSPNPKHKMPPQPGPGKAKLQVGFARPGARAAGGMCQGAGQGSVPVCPLCRDAVGRLGRWLGKAAVVLAVCDGVWAIGPGDGIEVGRIINEIEKVPGGGKSVFQEHVLGTKCCIKTCTVAVWNNVYM